MPQPPLMIDITRGPAVESRHAVHAVIIAGGVREAEYGDAGRLTFPRSAIKPLQAVALLESGAAEAFGLSNVEIALACASHTGEDFHVEAVAAWLSRLGLDETALECGAHAPYSDSRLPPAPLCNNCSGKHAGMLTLALHMKAPLEGYVDVHHPVQQKILQTLGEMCGRALTPVDCGIDGCSAPNPLMPLENIARGFAQLMHPETLGLRRGTACRHILQAMRENPRLIGGTKRFDTAVIEESRGEIICKIGGEGVYACVIPAKDTAIALKVEDGGGRAAPAALFALLHRHRLADAGMLENLRSLALPLQKNWRGITVGTTEAEGL